MRAIRQTGDGPKPMHSGVHGVLDLCVQRADSTSHHCHCQSPQLNLSAKAPSLTIRVFSVSRFDPHVVTDFWLLQIERVDQTRVGVDQWTFGSQSVVSLTVFGNGRDFSRRQ